MAQTAALPAQVEQKPLTLRDHLVKAQPEFAKALPSYIKPDRFVRTAQSALTFTRNIDKVTSPQSLLACCMKAAADGLILDGREAALVVDFRGDVQYRPMMRGLLKLAYNSGMLKGIVVEVACQGDAFSHRPTNLNEPISHEINHVGARGDVIAVYALAELKDGGIVHEVMSVAQVNAIRDRSDAWRAFKADKIKSTPWHTDWSEMARKTVFRRLSKYLPSSSDRDALHQAVERIDEDYSFTIDNGSTSELPAGTAPKKRGGAAAILKDVTPETAKPAQKKKAQPPAEDEHDPNTGEVFDHDAPDPNDPRFNDEGPQPGDDI